LSWSESVSDQTENDEVKDMNTSQNGKGSCQEDKSRSSNLDKQQQNTKSISNDKKTSNIIKEKSTSTRENENGEGNKVMLVQEIIGSDEVHEQTNIQPTLSYLNPPVITTKKRVAATADGIRMPKIGANIDNKCVGTERSTKPVNIQSNIIGERKPSTTNDLL
jgi:hypothetical protein